MCVRTEINSHYVHTADRENMQRKSGLNGENSNIYHILELGPISYLRIMATVDTKRSQNQPLGLLLNSKFRMLLATG